MFRKILLLSILLSSKTALGLVNETVLATNLYDDAPLIDIKHQIELLSSSNENLRLRLEIMDRRLTESSDEIKRQLAESSNKINGSLADILNEIKRSARNEESKKSLYAANCLNLNRGVHLIQIDSFSPKPFFVQCDNVAQGGGWTVIQKRIDGSVDFYRNWADYRRGFGNIGREFFIGLDKLHALTTPSVNELLIVMRDKANQERFAKYDSFAIGDESEYYALNVLGKYSGDAGDALGRLSGARFFTKDRDSPKTCAFRKTRGWWEREDSCWSSLNGKYGENAFGHGINWDTFHDFDYSLPYVQMMIRPKT